MERINAEVSTATTQPAEADITMAEKSKPYGKFNDANSLLKAYESLEAEFTRRSQKLKALEGERKLCSQKDKTELIAGDLNCNEEETLGRYDLSLRFKDEIERKQSDFSESLTPRIDAYVKILEGKLTEAESKLVEKEKFTERAFSQEVIKDYLKRIASERRAVTFTGGGAITAPPEKPKTIAEASAMAKKYLNQGENN